MKLLKIHKWNVSTKEAVEIQKQFCKSVILRELDKPVKVIAGCDVAFNEKMEIACAGVVLMSFPELEVISKKVAFSNIRFPYIPGLLSFRETPALLRVFKKINIDIDLVFVDGYGIAHPRKFGLASHLGIFLDLPAIGCGKTYLLGEYQEPKDFSGSYEPLILNGEVVGAVVRTKANVKPVFVSVGHKLNLNDAINFTLRCCKGYRLPEPIRQAHLLVNTEIRKKQEYGVEV